MLREGNLKYDSIVYDCRYLMHRLNITVLRDVFRKQNQAANWLAKGARRTNYNNVIIFIVPPVYVKDQLETDTIKTV